MTGAPSVEVRRAGAAWRLRAALRSADPLLRVVSLATLVNTLGNGGRDAARAYRTAGRFVGVACLVFAASERLMPLVVTLLCIEWAASAGPCWERSSP